MPSRKHEAVVAMPGSDPRCVLAFLAVVEHGSFRAASRTLQVPKSTLSQRVSALEEQLGVELLARTTRSVRLTDIGASYHREVSPMLDTMRAAEARVMQLQVRPTGHLRITAPFELGQRVFGEALGLLAARHPDVRVSLDLMDRTVRLVEEGYDLAVRVGPLDDSTMVARRLGYAQRVGLFASRGYLRRAGRPKTPRDVAEHRCLVMTGSQRATTWTFVQGRKVTHVPVSPHYAVGSFLVLTRLAERGAGIARLPERFAVGNRKLVEVLRDHAPPGRHCYAVYPSQRHPTPALRAMIDILVETFEGVPWGGPP